MTLPFSQHAHLAEVARISSWTDNLAGIEIDDMPHLKAWMKRIEERPAVQKGLDIPDENIKKQLARDPKKKEEMIESAREMMISHK